MEAAIPVQRAARIASIRAYINQTQAVHREWLSCTARDDEGAASTLGTRLSFTLNSSPYCRDGHDTGRGNGLGPASVERLQQPARCAAGTRSSSDEYADDDDHADDDAATTRSAARAAECRDAVSSEPRLTQAVAPLKTR